MEQILLGSILDGARRNRPNNNKSIEEILLKLEDIEKHRLNPTENEICNDVIDTLTGITTKTSTPVVLTDAIACLIWLIHLQQKQNVNYWNKNNFEKITNWIEKQALTQFNNENIICYAFVALGSLFSSAGSLCSTALMNLYFNASSCLLQLFNDDKTGKAVTAIVQSFVLLLNAVKDSQLTAEEISICTRISDTILQLFYKEHGKPKINVAGSFTFAICSLQIIQKTVIFCTDFLSSHTPELMGLLKSYAFVGINSTIREQLPTPQRLFPSQQPLYASSADIDCNSDVVPTRNNKGKLQKTRKPKSVTKASRFSSHHNDSLIDYEKTFGVLTVRTSDSDASENEAMEGYIYNAYPSSKIRLFAILLLGKVSHLLDCRQFYGYWHALFPSDVDLQKDSLLYIGQNDPRIRCRSAILQICAQIFFDSKRFLQQAELKEQCCPSTFIPFSVSLGYSIKMIFENLRSILKKEKSWDVLVQALKCTAMLMRATSFQQLGNNVLQSIVQCVKHYLYCRNDSVQTSALMVIEFMILSPNLTEDLAEMLGLPVSKAILTIDSNNYAIDNLICDNIEMDEFVESESEDDERKNTNTNSTTSLISKQNDKINSISKQLTICNKSWLLHNVLNNIQNTEDTSPASVRIASLQVLIALSTHFPLLRSNIITIANVLKTALNERLTDVLLHVVRCIDAYAYQISQYLEQPPASSNTPAYLDECNNFWSILLPSIVKHIWRNTNVMPTVKISMYDATSNMGSVIFEGLPHLTQIDLVRFVSAVSDDDAEDPSVRSSAVRALAVFAQFPSLLHNFVFVENTIELTLRLTINSNIVIRTKAFWALGNLSDVLVRQLHLENDIASGGEHICDDLLYRLINTAIKGCADNDKVRCNAVRILGNLLRLLGDFHLHNEIPSKNTATNWRQCLENAFDTFVHCIRSSGNAKVKWNTCYAISNAMLNPSIFNQGINHKWQSALYPALGHIILNHNNFKVRIHATIAVTNIPQRAYFAGYFEMFWSVILQALEQSHNLDNYEEYNHRDSLQEHLCFSIVHLLHCATDDDLPVLTKHLIPFSDIIHNTWIRVINRMVAERTAPLLACIVHLKEWKLKRSVELSPEGKNAIEVLIKNFELQQ